MKKDKIHFFITSWDETPGTGGICSCSLDISGKPEILHFTPLTGAGYLAFDREQQLLYATCKVNGSSDGVAAFAIRQDHSLEPLGEIILSGGISSCHLSVSPERKFLYCANYFSSSFSEFALDKNGEILRRTRIIHHHGSGPNTERQLEPHPHCCTFSPDGKFLTVCDLGNDTVSCYPFAEKSGIDEQNPVTTTLPPGSGPRHILFDPDHPLCYVINELGNSVMSFNYQHGKLKLLEELLLLPRGVTVPTKASAIRFSTSGNFLACANRGFDSIAVAKIDHQGGMTPEFLTFTGGSHPRDINFLGEEFFATANEFSDEIRFFDFDSFTGILSPNGNLLKMPHPRCIIPHFPLAKK